MRHGVTGGTGVMLGEVPVWISCTLFRVGQEHPRRLVGNGPELNQTCG